MTITEYSPRRWRQCVPPIPDSALLWRARFTHHLTETGA